MSNFRVGDKVVCINDSNHNDVSLGFLLEKNKVYIVKKVVNNEVYNAIKVEELLGINFNQDRFRLLSDVRKEKLNKIKNRI